ncbi:LPD29 domain-containing protein [Streptomyces sp. NPDC015125]|uniref:LPD29 domain-containing protein n=1 Tax=Streptomyces sp. NPDC015125 TaxID=3364938 RepID=UPI0036F5D2DF
MSSTDTVFSASDLHTPDYRVLRLTPGARVTYHGSVHANHGEWTVHPCSCRWCTRDVRRGIPATRYELRTLEGRATGPYHVRHTSVTPVIGDEEPNQADMRVSTKATASYLRRQLLAIFPGVKFSVRCGRDRKRGHITVTWGGGPSKTAVRTITAPLLAHYGTPERVRPRAITVTAGGRTYSGTPNAAAIHLCRSPHA